MRKRCEKNGEKWWETVENVLKCDGEVLENIAEDVLKVYDSLESTSEWPLIRVGIWVVRDS